MNDPTEHRHAADTQTKPLRIPSDVPFYATFGLLGGVYIVLIAAMLVAEGTYTTPSHLREALSSREVRYAIRLSLLSCGVTTILALWIAVPIGYLMSRHRFPGKTVVDGVLDIPIVLPPLVIGLCLLILFSSPVAAAIEAGLNGMETFVGDNLVPLSLLAVLVVGAFAASVAARRMVSNPAVRWLVATAACLGLFIVFARGSLFPQLPAWVPVSEGFETVNVAQRDQRPLWNSRHVYSARFRQHGQVDDVLKPLEQELSAAKFAKPNTTAKLGRDSRPSGEYVLMAGFGADVDADFPHGGEIEYRLIPQKPIAAIRELELELSDLKLALEPVEREYQQLRPKLDVAGEVALIRDKLHTVGDRWQSAELDRPLNQLDQTLDTAEEQAQAIQAKLDELPQTDKLAALRQRLTELRQETAETQRELAAVRDAWQSEPVIWTIECDVRRPEAHSRADLTPSFTFPVTYEIPGVILAQFMVACAFAVRTMRVTFDQIHPRYEQVALTLGCNHGQAFWWVVFPQSLRGLLAAGTLAWARSLGEFGPILIFAGATRMRTEVLPTTVFLEMTVGNIEGAAAASLIMVVAAMIVLVLARVFGLRRMAI